MVISIKIIHKKPRALELTVVLSEVSDSILFEIQNVLSFFFCTYFTLIALTLCFVQSAFIFFFCNCKNTTRILNYTKISSNFAQNLVFLTQWFETFRLKIIKHWSPIHPRDRHRRDRLYFVLSCCAQLIHFDFPILVGGSSIVFPDFWFSNAS